MVLGASTTAILVQRGAVRLVGPSPWRRVQRDL